MPLHYTPGRSSPNTTLQEFVTADFYRNHAARTGASAREDRVAAGERRDAPRDVLEARLRTASRTTPALCPASSPRSRSSACRARTARRTTRTARLAMEAAAFPSKITRSQPHAFVRLSPRWSACVGHGQRDPRNVFTEGNYAAPMASPNALARRSAPRVEQPACSPASWSHVKLGTGPKMIALVRDAGSTPNTEGVQASCFNSSSRSSPNSAAGPSTALFELADHVLTPGSSPPTAFPPRGTP